MRSTLLLSLDPDIICIQETKLLPGQEISLDGYKWIPFNRTYVRKTAKTGSGGIGIFVKQSMYDVYTIKTIDKQHEGILKISLTDKVSEKVFVVGCCYLPPAGGYWGRDAQSYFDHLLAGIYSNKDIELQIYCGDVNARIGSCKDYICGIDNVSDRCIIDTTQNKHGDTFIDFLHESNFCVLNGRTENSKLFTSVTSKGRSIVDYVFVPHSQLKQVNDFAVISPLTQCESVKYRPSGKLPDHSMLCLDMILSSCGLGHCASDGLHNTSTNQLHNHSTVTPSGQPEVRKRIKTPLPQLFLTSQNTHQLIEETIRAIENNSQSQQNIDFMYDKLCNIYYEDLAVNAPQWLGTVSKKRYRNKPKPWWSKELDILWKKLLQSENEYTAYSAGVRQIKRRLLENFQNAKKLFDKHYSKSKRFFLSEQQNKILDLNTNNPKEFWRKINELGPTSKPKDIPIEIIKSDGTVSNQLEDVLQKWKNDYEKLFAENVNPSFDEAFLQDVKTENELSEANMFTSNTTPPEGIDIMNDPISIQEVAKAVAAAKNDKAAGCDGLPSEVYKNDISIELLHKLFNACFTSGMIPSVWNRAVIKPLPKGTTNDPRIPLNYRGISLLCTMYKLYSTVINYRVSAWMESDSKFVEEQNGFRHKRSCMEHIYSLTSIIRNRKNANKSTHTCFIDMKKAFDSVNHACLFNEVLQYGVRDRLYYSIKSLYTSPVSAVKVNNHITEWFNVKTGVRQGDNLSTTLFAMFINDLAIELKQTGCGIPINDIKVCILFYADDIVILGENEQELQRLLDVVHSWTSKWRLLINGDKTKIIHFRPKSMQRTNFQFKCGSNIIAYTDAYPYLGCELNEHLDFTSTANLLAGAAGRAVGSIVNKHKVSGGLHYDVFKKIYDTCVSPIMDYCGAVWGFKDYAKCNTVQNRALRSFLGVHRYAPNLAIQGDTGWTPPIIRRRLDMIKFWHRIISMPDTRLPKQIFRWESHIGKNNWYTDLKKVFISIGKPELIDADGPNDVQIKNLTQDAVKLLTEREQRHWQNDLEKSPKLRTYRLCKNNWGGENYLKTNLTRQQRSLFCQLRCGILPLHIETGRYGPKPLKPEERICKLCNTEPETEFHYLYKCNAYTQSRNEFYRTIELSIPGFKDLGNNEKFNIMMNNVRLIKKTAIFIVSCYNQRTELLFNNVHNDR